MMVAITISSRPCETEGRRRAMLMPCDTSEPPHADLWVRVFDDVQHRSSADERHDHPQLLARDEAGVQREHVGVVVVLHELRLVDDLVEVAVHALEVHFFDSDDFVQRLAQGPVNGSRHAPAAVLEQLVVFSARGVFLQGCCQVLGALVPLVEEACSRGDARWWLWWRSILSCTKLLPEIDLLIFAGWLDEAVDDILCADAAGSRL